MRTRGTSQTTPIGYKKIVLEPPDTGVLDHLVAVHMREPHDRFHDAKGPEVKGGKVVARVAKANGGHRKEEKTAANKFGEQLVQFPAGEDMVLVFGDEAMTTSQFF